MMRKKITKIEKDLKALTKWLVGDMKKNTEKNFKALNKWLVGDKKEVKIKTTKKVAKKIKRKK